MALLSERALLILRCEWRERALDEREEEAERDKGREGIKAERQEQVLWFPIFRMRHKNLSIQPFSSGKAAHGIVLLKSGTHLTTYC